ncbi:dihydroneopterin aldolase [Andreprevotia lacus DSM 23236]|jgi:dihydroneopterin aldolase|uniref:Dihydroneopterin aldolase n=1 Tax=Andreprevotia lacus DSM 23236 TaxID=1121001 RepID=A0A1W1XDE5_9NEIS|nr:dihydroneopterin aldolase [Andreprevotia lacus]SMC21882.1 dihydroneopterin aldolase [Andreprevotia lacus DSM 23236]
MDYIYLHGVRAKTLIGWYDWERLAPQVVELDLEIGLPSSRAATSDNLTDTIDYDKVVSTLRASMAEQHFQLLEALAEHIAHIVLDGFGAPWVKVSVTKLGILHEVGRVGVTIERGSRE